MALTEHQIILLRDLIRWRGIATSKELGGYSALGARARDKSKREGFVTYDGGAKGYWRITEAGEAALKADQSPQVTVPESDNG
jgi:hypothetical protein